MSAQARKALVSHPGLVFQRSSQRDDLLDPNKTQTELIALLLELLSHGHSIELTAVRSDHHDDHCLGRHSHSNGFAADGWFLATHEPGDYLDARNPQFEEGIECVAHSAWREQIGLAGSADIPVNQRAAGSAYFPDQGADHIHLSAKG